MTYEETMQARKEADRKSMQARIAKPARLSAQRVIGGVRLVVTDCNTPELRDLVKSLGYTLVEDIANCYEIVCATPEALDAARNPLKGKVTA